MELKQDYQSERISNDVMEYSEGIFYRLPRQLIETLAGRREIGNCHSSSLMDLEMRSPESACRGQEPCHNEGTVVKLRL